MSVKESAWKFWNNPVDNALEKEYEELVKKTCPMCGGRKKIRHTEIRSMFTLCQLCQGTGRRMKGE